MTLADLYSLQFASMAGSAAALRHGSFCNCNIFRAASARSKKTEFTGWAQRGHSLQNVPMTALRDKPPLSPNGAG